MLLLSLLLAQNPPPSAKKPLDHSVYDGWQSIRGTTFSDDGKWIAYGIAPQEGDATLYIVDTAHPETGKAMYTVERGSLVRFTSDSKFAVITQAAPFAEVRAARNAPRTGGAAAEAPASGLVVLNLATGEKFEHARVSGTRLAEIDNGWLAYEPMPERRANASAAAGAEGEAGASRPTPPAGGGRGAGGGQRRAGGGAAAGGQRRGGAAGAAPQRGTTWTLRNLATGKEQTLSDVSELAFDKNGTELAYTTSAEDKKKNGVTVMDLKSGKSRAVVTAAGRYLHLTLSQDGKYGAFLSDNTNAEAKPPLLSVYEFAVAGGDVKALVKPDGAGLPKGWAPADGEVSFTRDDKRLTFQSAPKAVEEKPNMVPEAERAQIDVWNWQDTRLQSQQLLQADRDRRRSYLAVVALGSGTVTQEATPELRSVEIGHHGEAEVGFAESNLPYELQESWDEGYSDLYRVDLKTGKAMQLPTAVHNRAFLTPDGNTVAVFDEAKATMTSYDLRSGQSWPVKLPAVQLLDQEDDHPGLKPMYGAGPYLSDGKSLVVYDETDAWTVDVTGKAEPKCLTGGFGHRWQYQLRFLPSNLDPEEGTLDLSKPAMLSVRNLDDESTGVYKLEKGELSKLVYGQHGYAGIVKAKHAEKLAFTESRFDEFPDVWLTDTTWSSPTRLSAANPQAAGYLWGTCELVNWIGNDGQKLKGLLYKPEAMDPSKKYPMITYYYERNANTLYSYHPPAPSASTINISLFVSNGYVVFVPDIDYKVGYPGPSSYSAIIPGVQSIVARGFVDPKRLGLQGQSWGGYETAYLVTQTNMFAAAEAGAPVGDMFSAYGGIRGESGVVREGQYEHGQSRIGGSPWDKPLQYLENSPVFWADRVETPLMIMSNDADGAVPHTQGIELFTALRRLRKPSWMVVYNNEAHNLVERRNRKDLSVRLSQFFDHYLKGAPMPVWMAKGVPAVDKGKDYGLELVK